MKKILIVIGGVVIATIVLSRIPFMILSLTSKNMVCKSPEASILIAYDDKVKYHLSKDISFNLDDQNALVEKIGMDAYLEHFSNWFSTNTSGTCKK